MRQNKPLTGFTMYRVTQCLSVGPFASAERAPVLLAAGVTHVLNVSESPNHISVGDGFANVVWVPMSDSRQLAPATAVQALGALHEFASLPESRVYVHCIAGQIRSPTILWLYLLALGVPLQDARDWIESRAPEAVAGHFRMVDHKHISLAQEHGRAHFLPLARPELIAPFVAAESEQE